MSSGRVFVVYLRQPKSLKDMRDDPFWEKGSFGRTGCHSKNLLSRRCRIKPGHDSVLFAQGGPGCIRAMALVEVEKISPFLKSGEPGDEGRELRWDPKLGILGPFVFESAPLLIDSAGRTAFKVFKREHLALTDGKGWLASTASRFRARAEPISPDATSEVVRVMSTWRGKPALNFHEALPLGKWREHWETGENRRSMRMERYAELTKQNPIRGCR
jgi:hypothetical protein